MTRFRLLIYLHTSELQIYLSGSLLVKFFLINHWKKIRRQDYQIKSNYEDATEDNRIKYISAAL